MDVSDCWSMIDMNENDQGGVTSSNDYPFCYHNIYNVSVDTNFTLYEATEICQRDGNRLCPESENDN